jgi:hypothetical protein
MKAGSNFKQLGHARGRRPTIGLSMRHRHEEHGGKDCVRPEAL